MLLKCGIEISSAKTWLNWLYKREMAMWKMANCNISILLFKELIGGSEFESWLEVQFSYSQAGIVNHIILLFNETHK